MYLQRTCHLRQPTNRAGCPDCPPCVHFSGRSPALLQRRPKVTSAAVQTQELETLVSVEPQTPKTPASESSPGLQAQVGQYNWLRNWWPVSPTQFIDKQRPTKHTILGTELVVWWKEDTGTWQVFQDRCPHRLAPLSQGRIIENQLQCSYHGWSFGPKGECTDIPQLPAASKQAGCSQKRSCATAYPTQVVQGVLWVWMDPSPEGVELSQTQGMPITVCPNMSFSLVNNLSDARANWEQSMDATHANWLHHDQGFPMQEVIPMECIERPEVDLQKGFTMKHGGYSVKNKGMLGVREFIPPCHSIVTYQMPAGNMFTFHIMVVPVAPGQNRTLTAMGAPPPGLPIEQVITYHTAQQQPNTLTQRTAAEASQSNWRAAASNEAGRSFGPVKKLQAAYMKWRMSLPHWTTNLYSLGDQDMVMNGLQERNIIHGKLSTKNYHMPAIQSDAGVLAVNKWCQQAAYPQSLFGDRLHPAESEPVGHLPLDKLLDRGPRHVDYCIICQKGFKLVTQACWVVTVAAVLSGAFALATAAMGLIAAGNILAGGVPLAVSSLIAPLLAWAAVRLWDFREERFISGVKAWTRKGGLSLIPRV